MGDNNVLVNGDLNDHQTRLFQKIRRGKFSFHEQYWDPISDGAKDLIARCNAWPSLLPVSPSPSPNDAEIPVKSMPCCAVL